VSSKFFANTNTSVDECVRLTHIAAKLNAPVPDSFKYVTADGQLKPVTESLLVDVNSNLDLMVKPDWYNAHVIHQGYYKLSNTCTASEWKQWVQSERSKLSSFVPLVQSSKPMWYLQMDTLRNLLKARGFSGEPDLWYKSMDFYIQDWDFENQHWEYWKACALKDANFWAHLLNYILEQPPNYWQRAKSARIAQRGKGGVTRSVTTAPLLPAWILTFRELPCLWDTHKMPHQPAELLTRVPATDSLKDVELFVQPELDNDTTRPLLLMLE